MGERRSAWGVRMPAMKRVHSICRAAQRAALDEGGTELVEILAFFPIVCLILLIAWQFILIGFTGERAAAAAREGARRAAVAEPVGPAVEWATPEFDGRRRWIGGACGGPVEVFLEIPHVIFPFIGGLGRYPEVPTRAEFRCEPPFDWH